MGKLKRRHVSADEQDILDHLQVRLLTSPKDRARCDELIIQHHYLHDAPKQIWVRELVKRACVQLRAAQLPPEWAMVEAGATLHCTSTVKEIGSLMQSLRQELPESRRPQALGYPLAGMICLIVMAMATGARQGPDDRPEIA